MIRAWLLSGTALVLAAAAPAMAQDAPPATGTAGEPNQASPQPGAPGETGANSTAPADQASSGLQDIVVTAQRRSENLQRVAIAVSAVSGDALVNRSVTNPDQLSKLVPALVLQPVGGTNINIYVRGVGSLGGGPTNENAIAFSVDGVFLGRPSGTVGTLYDLERVEVLKGPQGTLYGRNSTGGAINVITRKPVIGQTGANLTFEVGNYSEIKTQAAVNLPIGDSLALRVATQIVQRDGYLSSGFDDEVGQAARAQLLFKPNSSLSVLLSGDYYHQGGTGAGSVLVPNAVVPSAPELNSFTSGYDSRSVIQARFPAQYPALYLPNTDAFINANFWGVSATIDYDLGFATLTAIPAYRRSTPNYLGYRPSFYNQQTETNSQKSGELRLTSHDTSRLRYVLGFYYFDQTQDANALNKQSAGNQSQVLFNIKTKSYAPFGQLTFALSDQLRLVGGVRYTHEEKTQVASIRNPTDANPNPAYSPLNGNTTFSKVTWKGGVEFDIAPRSLLYANVATGFKSGGIGQYSNTRPDLNNFQPETLTAYTVGSKNRFFDNRVQFNVEGFYWDYRGQQLSVLLPRIENPASIGAQVVNVGKARLYGVDTELRIAATPRDSISLNAQYLNSRYLNFQYTTAATSAAGGPPVACPSTQVATTPARLFLVDCSGRPSLNAPRWSLTGSYQHTFNINDNLDVIASASPQYQTSRFLAIEFQPEERQRAFVSTDLSLTAQRPNGDWSFTLWVNNVENTAVKNQVFQRTIQGAVSPTGPVVVYYAGLRAPRTYGARASFKF